jgi:ribose/xylose/arabinose/galactoside ABC-type transport system permease subunit
MVVNRGRELSVGAFLLLLALILVVFAPGFYDARNLSNVLVNMSYLMIAAVGMTAVILTGHIDISIGAVLAACSTAAGLAAKAGTPIPLVFLLAITLGAALGAVNGALVAYVKVHSIIVTLATLAVIRGTIILLTRGAWIYDLPADFRAVGTGRWLGVPIPVWVMLITALAGSYLLSHTRWGRSVYAIGSNRHAAHLAGINVNLVQMSVFVLQGALVGLSAMVFATRFTTIQSNTGVGFEFLVITAVVAGGTNIFGGSGTILGTFLGALLVAVTGTVLTFLRISAFWEQTLQGLFILLAVSLDALRSRRPRARLKKGAVHAGKV